MHPFKFIRVASADDAIAAGAQQPLDNSFIAGGTTVIDLMKLDVLQPQRLVDINKAPIGAVEQTESGGVIIGALAKNSDLAEHPLIQKHYPVLSQALLSGASAQLRNMATVGGNLLQRTRCPYFRDVTMPCNKRQPGSGCPAIEGFSRMHAIFGGSSQCIAVHPSDMCVALSALDAVIHTRGTKGDRKIRLVDFYVLPGNEPQHENILLPGELITAVELPPTKFTHWHYLKVRDRSSFSFALASVAACLTMGRQGEIVDAHIALGGVGTVPWRARKTERMLIGALPPYEKVDAAAAEAIRGAQTTKYNKFKVDLTKRSIVRAVKEAMGVA